jgi:tRNA(fMet)-specific endonuclease VapC
MRRFLLDTGIAGDFINRRRGIYERARHEVAQGNRVGIGIPVLAELAEPIMPGTGTRLTRKKVDDCDD